MTISGGRGRSSRARTTIAQGGEVDACGYQRRILRAARRESRIYNGLAMVDTRLLPHQPKIRLFLPVHVESASVEGRKGDAALRYSLTESDHVAGLTT